jgi:peroxiredoxin
VTDEEARLAAALTAQALPVGAQAPDFALPSPPDRTVALAEFRGRPLVLVFYPNDWSPVCTDQLVALSARRDAIAERGAAILAVSVDGVWSHAAYAEARNLAFPLLADFHPKGAVCRAFGVWSEEWGHAHRALFVLDGAGVVRWRSVVPPWIDPGVDGVLAALHALA